MAIEDETNDKPTAPADETMDKTERSKEEEASMTHTNEKNEKMNETTTSDDEIKKTERAPTPTTNDEEAAAEEIESPGLCQRIWNRLWLFYNNNDFIVQIVIAILLARAYPPLGAEYLQPEITSTWIAVIFIFGACLL
jgi:sodium/bile acid cotransporter 7